MDKITHQVRADHWTGSLNECMKSGMSKTAWYRANEISEKPFEYYSAAEPPAWTSGAAY